MLLFCEKLKPEHFVLLLKKIKHVRKDYLSEQNLL
jgi:hypothetical protein